VALQLAHDGYDIAFCYRQSVSQAEALAEDIRALGRQAFYRCCQVEHFEQVAEFVRDVEDEFGEIHVLVNNAGITRDQMLLRMSEDEWDDVISTNLKGVFNFCRVTMFSLLKRKSGRVINISSVSGVGGQPGQSNYSASKAGMIGFSKALSKEVGRYGIRVNVVAPGYIDTDMTVDLDPKVRESTIARTSLARTGKADEIADAVSFLASTRSSFITGQVLCVDGGLQI
jgi:3-oxoacyl-[acyl-carrier protein] reductase